MKRPVIDIHCDLLIYLTRENSDINTKKDIGASIPFLQAGNVKLQTMAIFTPTEDDSHVLGIKQSEIFRDLVSGTKANENLYAIDKTDLNNLGMKKNTGVLVSLENASSFCDERMPLAQGFKNLEKIRTNVGNIFYISLTHHAENRFGGGNYSSVGLKEDGKVLLDYISGKHIALDFSHTSDALADDLLNYLSQQNLDIPIIASHSNYRPVWDHPRNLPDDIAKEIIRKEGLIGINFLRSFLNTENPDAIYDHISHGIALGGRDAICYGADYFHTGNHPDPSRIPYYFAEHENAARYPAINAELEKRYSAEIADKISYLNVQKFLNKLWKTF